MAIQSSIFFTNQLLDSGKKPSAGAIMKQQLKEVEKLLEMQWIFMLVQGM